LIVREVERGGWVWQPLGVCPGQKLEVAIAEAAGTLERLNVQTRRDLMLRGGMAPGLSREKLEGLMERLLRVQVELVIAAEACGEMLGEDVDLMRDALAELERRSTDRTDG